MAESSLEIDCFFMVNMASFNSAAPAFGENPSPGRFSLFRWQGFFFHSEKGGKENNALIYLLQIYNAIVIELK